jgi:hypothetical protein
MGGALTLAGLTKDAFEAGALGIGKIRAPVRVPPGGRAAEFALLLPFRSPAGAAAFRKGGGSREDDEAGK